MNKNAFENNLKEGGFLRLTVLETSVHGHWDLCSRVDCEAESHGGRNMQEGLHKMTNKKKKEATKRGQGKTQPPKTQP